MRIGRDSVFAGATRHGLALIFIAGIFSHHVGADPFLDRLMSDIAQRNDSASIANHKKWRKSLPRCAPGISGLHEDWPGYGDVKNVHGVLKTGRWKCTIMSCNHRCCNFCNGEWEFITQAELVKPSEKRRGIEIHLAGKSEALRHSGMDCAADSIDNLPLLEVVVSGDWNDNYALRNATLCVIGESAASSRRNPSGKK